MQRKKGKRRVIYSILLVFGIALYLFGAYLILFPVSKAEAQPSAKTAVAFTERSVTTREKTKTVLKESAPQELTPSEIRSNPEIPYADLLADLMQYNHNIYLNAQIDFKDAWAYKAQKFDLKQYGIEDEVIAVIDIPALEECFPIYLGATSAHLGNGLAQLTETSVPVGGTNTNCVIAGHRGWDNGKYLRDIEKIQLGDVLTVTNLWETLHYEVVDIEIIRPNNIDEVKIKEGRDLITLVTCHPYASGGRYRYLVICERVEGERSSVYMEDPSESTQTVEETEEVTTVRVRTPRFDDERIDFFSSSGEIFLDEFLRILGIIMVILVPIIVLIAALVFRHKRKKREEERRIRRAIAKSRRQAAEEYKAKLKNEEEQQ